MAEYDNKVALGSSITQLVTLIKNALSGKQNTLTAGSGIDITNNVISSTGGGSSLPTDPSTDGSYKLVNTVETDSETQEQTATLSWEEIQKFAYGMTGMDLLQFLSGTGITMFEDYINKDMPIANSLESIVYQLKNRGWCYTATGVAEYSRTILTNLNDSIVNSCWYIGGMTNDLPTFYASSNYLISSNYYIFYQPTASNSHLYVIPNNQYNGRLFGNYIGFKSTQGLTATTLAKGIDEVATTRIADTLVSTETTPSTNNTINWLYE